MLQFRYYLSFVFISLMLSHPSSANVGEAFGFGAKTQSLAGAGVTLDSNAFAAYHNPAALALGSDKVLHFDFGLLYIQPNFIPINNVLTQNNFNADADAVGTVNTSYRATFGQQLGFSYQFLPDSVRFTVGLASFLPVEQLAFMDTGEAYIPEYFLYRSRTQRPQFDFGFGIAPWKDLAFGLGFHVAYSLTSNGTLFINTSPNRISSMRFSTSLKPKIAPFLGVLYSPKAPDSDFSFGTVFRFPATSDNTIILNSSARVFGDFAAIDFNFNALSSLFYDPMALEMGGAWRHSPIGKLYLQLEYQLWGRFSPPALVILQPTTTNCQTNSDANCEQTIQISPGALPPYPYHNIWIPRIAEELYLSSTTVLRFGYTYRPSILENVSNGNGNYLDPSKHQFNLGLGLEFKHLAGLSVPVRLDLNVSYQKLITQTITKTPGNETGDLLDGKIGSPGYEAGGNLFGGGVSLSLAF